MATRLNNPNEEQVFVHVLLSGNSVARNLCRGLVALTQISLLHSIHYPTVCDVTGLLEIYGVHIIFSIEF